MNDLLNFLKQVAAFGAYPILAFIMVGLTVLSIAASLGVRWTVTP